MVDEKDSNTETVKRSQLLLQSRALAGQIHESACNILRLEVLPVLRNDKIVNLIINDELIILYGNQLCQKYRDLRHQNLIRSTLRLLGRFLHEMKKLDNTITDFASLIAAHQYENCVKAVDILAGLQDDGRFKNFSVATRIGTLLKKVTAHYRTICIEQNKRNLVTGIDEFLNVLQDE